MRVEYPIFLSARKFAIVILAVAAVAHVSYGHKSPHQIQSVAISPNGKLLAIVYGDETHSFIYEVAVDTRKISRLTAAASGEELNPSFSPDGKQIAYAYRHNREGHFRIVIVDANGSNPHEWPPANADDFSPLFAPDEKTIIFSRIGFFGNYSPIAQPHPHTWNFYAANLNGTNLRKLTNEPFYMVSPASISRDGKSMVIVAEGFETNRRIAIYSLTAPASPARAFQPHVPKEADQKNPIIAYPNYLPDGTIVFMAASNGRHGYDYDVYRLDVETDSLSRLTRGNGYATDLKVSADGNTAVFLRWRKNWIGDLTGDELYLLDVHSRNLRPLELGGLPY